MKIIKISSEQISENIPIFCTENYISSINDTYELFGVFDKELKAIFYLYYSNLYETYSYYFPIYFLNSKKQNVNEILNYQLKLQSEISKFIIRKNIDLTINLQPSFIDCRGFQWQNLNVFPRFTYIINLHDNFSNQYFHSTKKAIKKLNKVDAKFDETFHFEAMWMLINKTFERQKKTNFYKKKDFLNIFNNLKEKNLIKQFSIVYKDEIIASRIILLDDNFSMSYDYLAGADPQYLNLGINSSLLNYLLNNLKGNYSFFDFCGANVDSIARFKSSFGGQLKPFYQIRFRKKNLKNNLKLIFGRL